MKSTDKFVLVLVASLSLLFAGCGGGGGSSDEMTMNGGNGGGGMTDCPEGQTGAPPNCMTPGPSQEDIDAEAMRMAGALGGTATDANVNVLTTPPTGAAIMMGKVTTGTMATSFKEDTDASYTPITGFSSNAYTQTNQAGNVMVEGVLYNNIEAPTAQRYAVFFTDATSSGVAFLSSSSVTGNGATGELTFTAAGFNTGDHADKFMGARFPSGENMIRDFMDDEETDAKENEVAGSFFGVPGTFACTGDPCTARTNADGDLSAFVGAWTFTPTGFTEGAAANPGGTPPTTATGTMVQGVVPDPEYLVFGYWLEKTTAADGTETYKVRLYQGGDATPATDVSAAEGTATYAGPATGLYMHKTVDANGDPISPFSSGQFTADAELTASFSGGTVGASHQNTVTGTISGFTNSAGEAIGNNWVLTLGRTVASTDGTFTGTDMTTGYKDGTTGDWAGTFYGDNPAAATDRPGSAAGTFNGHFRNGHVAGAFGVTLQEN